MGSKWRKLLWLLLLAVPAFAQSGIPTFQYVTAAPTGSCAGTPSIQIVYSTGAAYSCNSGTWGTFAGGGGGGATLPTNAIVFGLSTTTSRAATLSDLTGLGAAPLASPALTGAPTTPTQTTGDNTNKIATDAFVLANSSILPTATAAGQVPRYTGAGTTATAQFADPAGSTIYLANYLANPTVPTQVRWDCTWGTGSSPQTITCPSGTFTSSMTGWVAWATQLNPGGNAEVANNFACGGAGTNPTLTYVSSTSATINTSCSVASGSSTTGGSAFIFGPDETSAVDTWVSAVANACGTGVLPSGIVLTEHGGGGWNMTAAQNTNCGNATGVHTGGAVIAGQGITRSTIGIEPAFDFTTCTGGPTSNTCFGSAKTNASGILVGGYSFHDLSISGFGSTLDSSTQINWVEMLYGNYANNFAITKLGGTGVSHTVGIKLNGAFGQFWNLISDWSAAIPCWVTNGSPYAPNVMGGSSECVGGSGAAVSGIGSSYGVFISSGGWLVSHGNTYAGGDTNNIASEVTIAGGTFQSKDDTMCCTNTGTVMAVLSFTSAGGTATLDGFSGSITNMGNGSQFISTAASGSPSITVRNTNVTIGGGSGQICYNILSGTFDGDSKTNKCSGASAANVFQSWTYTGPLNAAQCIGCPNSSTYPPSATGPTFSPTAGTITSGTTVTTSCSTGSPYISTGTTPVAGATGIAVSTNETLYGACQGSGMSTQASAAYTVGILTYVNTTFNEASSGNLSGTAPATCTNGCTGNWTQAIAGTDFTYTGSNSVTTAFSSSGHFDYINAGVSNAVVRFNLSGCTGAAGNCQFIFRYSSGNNYIAMNCTVASGGSCQMYDGPGFSTIGSAITGTVTGSYTVTFSGTAVTLVTPNGTTSGTTANTGTNYGFDLQSSSSSMTVSSFSVKSS